MSIDVVVIEEHPLMLRAIVRELEGAPGVRVVGTGRHGSALLRLARETEPDVLVLDPSVGGFEPVEAVKALLKTRPQVQILVFTARHNRVWVQELIAAGVKGYVFKDDRLSLDLVEGVRTVCHGGRFYSAAAADQCFECTAAALSAQEVAILELAARGFSNGCIGRELGLAEKTVRNTFSTIYNKLEVQVHRDINSRVAVVKRARDLGLLRE